MAGRWEGNCPSLTRGVLSLVSELGGDCYMLGIDFQNKLHDCSSKVAPTDMTAKRDSAQLRAGMPNTRSRAASLDRPEE